MTKDLSINKTCASKVLSIVEIPHGVRIQADNLLTMDIAGYAKGDIAFTLTRLLGYEGEDKGYMLFEAPEDVIPEAGENEVVLSMGDIIVRAGRSIPDIRVEREGKLLFSI